MTKSIAKGVRSRNWRLISYLPLDVVLERLSVLVYKQYVRYYAVAEHDKDVEEDGSLKDRHVHILVNLYNGREQREICGHFIDVKLNAGNCFGIVMDDKKDAYEYLTHKNDLDKYQYDSDIVISNNDVFFAGDSTDYDEQAYCILIDMLNGVSLPDMVKRYGRDFAIHYHSYRAMVYDIKEQKCLSYKYESSRE